MEARLSQSKSMVRSIRLSAVGAKEKKNLIEQYKEKNQISSRTMIFSACTSMIGTGILVYPQLYKDNGMILSQIILTLIGLISYKTAQLCLMHIKEGEEDLTKVVARQLGPKWHKVYCFTGGFYLAMCSGIFYLLILNTLYSQISFVYLKASGHHLLKKDIYSFQQYSFQWTNVICLLFFVVIVNLKSLKIIMKLGEFSFIGIIIFTIYCLIKSFINIDYLVTKSENDPSFQFEGIKLFSNQFAVMAGSCAVAFNVHNMIVPISQQRLDKKNNQRDLKIIFLIGYLVYSLIGALGYVAILNKKCNVKQANTFMDYVPEDEIAGFLVDFFLLCKLVSITPLYVYLSKNQLFEVFYKDTPSPKWLQHGFNVLFLIYIAIMGNFNIQPTVLIGLNGSYGGLILIYIVPIAIHLKCIYTSNCKINHKKSYKKSSVANQHRISDQESYNNEKLLIDGYTTVNVASAMNEQQLENNFSECQQKNWNSINKYLRKIFYYILIIAGTANSVLVIENLFQN